MSASSWGARRAPAVPSTTDTSSASASAWTAARGAFGVLLADAACDHRGGADTEPHRERVDDGEQRFGETDGGDGAGPEAADPEDVGHREDALQHHFEHHGDGEQEHRPADRSHGEIVMHFAADRLSDDGPEAD